LVPPERLAFERFETPGAAFVTILSPASFMTLAWESTLTNPWLVTDWLLAGSVQVRRLKKKVAGVGFECS
jgi:hypothetical protein